jgi:hypothetical protein
MRDSGLDSGRGWADERVLMGNTVDRRRESTT